MLEHLVRCVQQSIELHRYQSVPNDTTYIVHNLHNLHNFIGDLLLTHLHLNWAIGN